MGQVPADLLVWLTVSCAGVKVPTVFMGTCLQRNGTYGDAPFT